MWEFMTLFYSKILTRVSVEEFGTTKKYVIIRWNAQGPYGMREKICENKMGAFSIILIGLGDKMPNAKTLNS